FLRRYNVWRIPKKAHERIDLWQQVARAVEQPAKGTSSAAYLTAKHRREGKIRLDQVESLARSLEAQELLTGAQEYLKVSDPNSNRRAIRLLGDHLKKVVVGSRARKQED